MSSRRALVVASLKKAKLAHARLCHVPIKHDGNVVGHLVPIGPWILEDWKLISEISEWRARAMVMFLSQFESTPEKTAEYLRNCSIGDDNRILFMIEVEGEFLGHVGLAGISHTSAELDNLMRGISGGKPELMEASERTLVSWAFTTLKLKSLYLKILSYNFMAKTIHEQMGFLTTERLPLRQEIMPDRTTLVECEASEATVSSTCDVMVLGREAFLGD